MRANGNPIWGLICQGTKLLQQISSWTPSMGITFIRTMVLIWMGGSSGQSLAVSMAEVGAAFAIPLRCAERQGREALSVHPLS